MNTSDGGGGDGDEQAPAARAAVAQEEVDELVKEALEIVLDARRHPVLVVCSSGAHQTGAVVGCLRRLQQWNLVAILAEYRRFAGDKRRFRNEQFVELFDVDLLTLPEALPSWFPREEQVFDDGGE